MGERVLTEAKEELERARGALADAQVLLEGEGTDAGVLNRLYYAGFHGAQAALYARGENPASHGHVRQLFGQHLVLEGEVPREMGRFLGTLYDSRWEADYGAGAPALDLRELWADVEASIELMDELINVDEASP